ncbi:hypothetical protein HYZ70_00890 [Candidatus Curtissbacteria bacterium]|nr:hypothetical protein [Candidatus Curtissbacteria bacterium]
MDQKKLVEILAFWVVNTAVLLISSFIFGNNVVLGNDKVSAPMAAVISGGIITAFGYLVPPVVARSGYKIKNENLWGGIYFVANALVVWVVKRFALLLGLGVASIFYVILVAVLLTGAQWAAARATGAMGRTSKR